MLTSSGKCEKIEAVGGKHGQAIHSEVQVPGGDGGADRREECGTGGQGVWVHPNTVNAWKRTFLEKGAEVFAQDSMVAEYERRIADLERLLGKKEVEIALFENFLGQAK